MTAPTLMHPLIPAMCGFLCQNQYFLQFYRGCFTDSSNCSSETKTNCIFFVCLKLPGCLMKQNMSTYLGAVLSSTAGFYLSSQLHNVYPSQIVSSTQFYQHLQGNYYPFFRHGFPLSSGSFISVFTHQTL